MELEFLEWLDTTFPAATGVAVGIGDDAAVLPLDGTLQLVVATDMLIDGVHFNLSAVDPRRVGRKALAVNLSDLAAMAATPTAAFVSLAVPLDSLQLAQQIMLGMRPLCEKFAVAIAGGDTNVSKGPTVVNVAVVGTASARGPLLRSGTEVGDAILVTGALGGSILGRHLDFTPRVNEAIHLHKDFEVHAAIDISDGLLLDLSRMAKASGCGVELDLSDVPVHDDAVRLAEADADGQPALQHALSDGEDFELLLAMPPGAAQRVLAAQPLDCPITQIGHFVQGHGMVGIDNDGARRPIEPAGFEHR